MSLIDFLRPNMILNFKNNLAEHQASHICKALKDGTQKQTLQKSQTVPIPHLGNTRGDRTLCAC